MYKINRKKPIFLFVLFLAAVILVSSAFILISPNDLPQAYPDNTSGNLLSGGAFAPGDDISFYLDGDKLYSLFGDKKTLVKSDAGGPIFATDGAIVYTKENSLYHVLADGSAETLLLANVQNPLIIGRWIYSVDGSGQLIKQRIDDGKQMQLHVYPNGQYYVSATRIYYIGTDGFLYTAMTDGTENALVCAYKMTDFIVGGTYIFYRNEGGVLCWFPLATPEAKAEHIDVAAYNYVDGYVVYRNQNEISAISLKTMDVTVVTSDADPGTKLYCDDHSIYYFNNELEFTRISPDGSEKKIL